MITIIYTNKEHVLLYYIKGWKIRRPFHFFYVLYPNSYTYIYHSITQKKRVWMFAFSLLLTYLLLPSWIFQGRAVGLVVGRRTIGNADKSMWNSGSRTVRSCETMGIPDSLEHGEREEKMDIRQASEHYFPPQCQLQGCCHLQHITVQGVEYKKGYSCQDAATSPKECVLICVSVSN